MDDLAYLHAYTLRSTEYYVVNKNIFSPIKLSSATPMASMWLDKVEKTYAGHQSGPSISMLAAEQD